MYQYKTKTFVIITIIGLVLAICGLYLKEDESLFNHLEKKQTGLGFIPPLFFAGFLTYRKKQESKQQK